MKQGTSGKQKEDSKLKRKIGENEKFIREFALNNGISISVVKTMFEDIGQGGK